MLEYRKTGGTVILLIGTRTYKCYSILILPALLHTIISCLGLFGLAAYTAERRTKEIGIRKVLGASVQGIDRKSVV